EPYSLLQGFHRTAMTTPDDSKRLIPVTTSMYATGVYTCSRGRSAGPGEGSTKATEKPGPLHPRHEEGAKTFCVRIGPPPLGVMQRFGPVFPEQPAGHCHD